MTAFALTKDAPAVTIQTSDVVLEDISDQCLTWSGHGYLRWGDADKACIAWQTSLSCPPLQVKPVPMIQLLKNHLYKKFTFPTLLSMSKTLNRDWFKDNRINCIIRLGDRLLRKQLHGDLTRQVSCKYFCSDVSPFP